MIRRLKTIYHYVSAVLAAVWFGFPGKKLTVIGVTGTDGKTTTTTLIYEILKASGYKTSMITSVHAVIAGKAYDTGFHVTTPTCWHVQRYLADAVRHGDTHMVLEVTSHALDQYRVWGVPFKVGVITNVTHEHLDWHKTFGNYLATKMRLLSESETAIVNRDEEAVYGASRYLPSKARIVTYGLGKSADVGPANAKFKTMLPGDFNRYNCLAAIAAARELGVSESIIMRALAAFSGVPGRMQTVALKPFRVIVDFAHTPNAIDKALSTLRPMTKGRLIHVFGSAGLRDHTKRPDMGKASSRYADVIVLTEEDYRTENVETIMDNIASGITGKAKVLRIPSRKDALKKAFSLARPGDLVVLTGKGCEQSLCRGTIEYPWNDATEAKRLLGELKA